MKKRFAFVVIVLTGMLYTTLSATANTRINWMLKYE